MREIFFRGKRTDTGEWVEGSLVWIRNYEEQPYQCFIISQLSYLEYGEFDEMYQVYPETVGQYTGLTDKNGKKIFEGDIVKYGDTVHKVVFEQRNGTAYFGLVYSPLETLPFGHYQDLRQIEVIGNIHDNLELLKGGE